jgi:hypothetical protein
MDCGVGMPETALELGVLVRSASHSSKYLDNGIEKTRDATIAVCSVKIGSPPIEMFTIVNGLVKETPLLGRFMLHDVVTRSYCGIS